MTIRTRLTLWYSGLLTLIIVIFALTVMTVNRISILAVIDQSIAQTALGIAQSLTVLPIADFGTPKLQIQRIEGLNDSLEGGFWVQIWQVGDATEPMLPRLVQESAGANAEGSALDHDALSLNAPRVSETRFNGVQTRVASHPITLENGQTIGVVQVGASINALDQASDALFISMTIATLISLAVSVGLGVWVSARLLKPLGSIAQAAAGIVNADDLSTRLTWEGPMDEIGNLTAVINQTLARLESLFKVQQRFVGDVSHELRTPLTSILGNLEIMQRYGVDDASLNAVYREAERMSRMVNDLLLLARADNGELKVELQAIDLEPILLEVYEQAHFLKKQRDLKIRLGELEPAPIMGNHDRLKQLLLNLVNNAIKFTPDGGTVTLSLTCHADEAHLDVQDTGIGISPDDQARIFDRFFQADNSRAQRGETDGAGLGLSIARWIADVHHARIAVTSELGKGTRFRVILPLRQGARASVPALQA
jgi:signal transduction histidine kinase